MRALLVIALALALAGCSGSQGIDRVEVQVQTPCIEKAPKRPSYRFGKGAKPASDVEMAHLLARDFEAAEQYGNAWEAAAAGCVITGGE